MDSGPCSRLLVMRHAHAASGLPGQRDFDRPLSASGEHQAQRMGQILVARELVPGLIVASPAARTIATAQIVQAQFTNGPQIVQDPAIYDAGPGELLEVLSKHFDHAATTMLVGHNPGISRLPVLLARPATSGSGGVEELGTGAVAHLQRTTQAGKAPGPWSKVNVLLPK